MTRTEDESSTLRSIRTGFVVTVITLLIWIAADQGVTTEEPINLTIRPVSVKAERYIAFAEPPFERDIDVQIRGRRRRIEELKAALASRPIIEIPIDDIRPPSTEPYGLSVRDDLLRRIPEIRRAGTPVETKPAQLSVRIDEFVKVPDIPLRVDFGEVRVRDESSVRSVTARIPRFVEADEQFQANRRAMVDAASLISERTPGKTFDVTGTVVLDLPIEIPPSAIRLTPEAVRITGQIETTEEKVTKGPIAVKWIVPDIVQKEYIVAAERRSDELIVNVDVRGPKERLAQLDASRIRAFVEVQLADTSTPGPGKPITRDIVFLLPPGFHDCRITDISPPLREVRFTLEPRSATNGTSDDGDAAGG